MAIGDGSDVPAVAEMMGHSSPALTLSVYTHPVEERKRALADRAALRFMTHAEATQDDKVQNKVPPLSADTNG